MMKKKILLAALFSVTAVLAAIGLATEKTMAVNWDDDFWGKEMIEGFGLERIETIYCTTVAGGSTLTIAKSAKYCDYFFVNHSTCIPYAPC